MIQEFQKIEKIYGMLELPGDKSISHRAVMFSAMAKGKSIIKNISNAEDVNSTINCFKNLGCEISFHENKVEILGKGFKGFSIPEFKLDARNSGTTARLISGILAAQNFESEIIGDDSLSKRPMKRIIEPLKMMNAKISSNENFTLPVKIFPSELTPIKYEMPVASAQVKSSIILAAIHLDEESEVIENIPTRNHTELLLNLEPEFKNNSSIIKVSKKKYPVASEYFVPSDISTAAFFIVLTLINKGSELIIKNVGLNETRTGIISILQRMSAKIEILNQYSIMNEKIGDIKITSGELVNVEIPEEIIPNIIDEIPVLSVAGLFAEGNFRIKNAKELRVKESDRIKALCENYKLLGIEVYEFEDGFELSGNIKNKNVQLESFGDHRIAMAFSVLALSSESKIKINNFECVSVSNPDFLDQLKSIIK